MRKIFKNVAFAAATTLSAASILTLASCTFKPSRKEEAKLDRIDVSIPDAPFWVEHGTTEQVEQPIEVSCFDQFGKAFVADTNLVLTTSEDLAPPNWIWIDENNKINIEGSDQPSAYDFHLFAQDKDGKVKSEVKSFCVEIFENEPVAPDRIEILCDETNKTVFTTSTGDISLVVNAYKEDCPEELIIKECNWFISSFSGPKLVDLEDKSLFSITKTTDGSIVQISSNVDASYCGLYEVNIKAESVADPNVFDEIKLYIQVVDGFYFYDSYKKYTYTRTSLNDGWTLSLVDSSTITLDGVLEKIYSIPVDSVAKNLCSYSGVRSLSTCILPSSIRSIGENAFVNQTYLYSLAIPGVEFLGKSCFEGCFNVSFLKTYDQPCLQVIKDRAFYGCSSLKFSEEITHQITEIGDQAFRKTAISVIKLGGCVQNIGDNVFYDCSSLKYIDINCTNPPKLDGPLYGGSTNITAIRVPLKGVENYKNSQNWSVYSDIIIGI